MKLTQHSVPTKEPEVVIGTADKQRLTLFVQRYLGYDISHLVDIYQALFSRIARSEGTLQAVKRCKQYYDVALRHAAGLTITPIPYCRSSRDGLPVALKAYRPYLEGDLNARRAALTVLQLFKLKPVSADFSTDSITRRYLGSTSPWWLPAFDEVLKEEFPPEHINERLASLKAGLHVSGKNGPNGPALLTSPIDREAIRGDVLENAIKDLCQATQNVYLDTLLEETHEEPFDTVTNIKDKEMVHSRIRVKHEPGGKSRLFCICDYFSQSALLPLHKFLMDWLQKQHQDGTSNHSYAAKAVSEWTDGRYGTNLWSFDLTTATDRYPRFLEKRVLEAIFGQSVADAWERVVSDREFVTPNGKLVRFAAGQPLGALSSWAAFAVTHHIHIRTAGRLTGVKPRYKMIGDDITIAKDLRTAQMYIDMMTDLDVPFSEAKSILPSQMKGKPVAELAKRVFCDGSEITPIPPDAILDGVQSPIGLKNLIEVAILRGYKSASMVYPVQSSIPSQEWYPELTFPVRNRLPQLNEVKLFRPIWEMVDEEPPAGLNRGWFTWSDFSDNDLEYLLRELLLKEVKLGYIRAVRLRNTLYEWSLLGPDFDVEGGDWQPEPWNLHMTMLPRIVDYMTERLEEILEDIVTTASFDDVYMYVGGLHSFIEPEQTFLRKNLEDQKQKTRVFMSKMIKDLHRIARHQDPIAALVHLTNTENLGL